MMKSFTLLVSVAVILFLCNGCISYDKLTNYQESPAYADSVRITNAPEIRIQPSDVLSIRVFSSDTKSAMPFNITPADVGNNFTSVELIQLSGYLVDKAGTIDFPEIGTMAIAGMTISEVKEFVLEKLKIYLKDPVVNVRLLNFRITIAGEVLNPGSYNILNERVTIPEAISMAGDLTDYADRSNVLIVREENGVRSFHRVNLQTSDLFQSELFYLKQNDYLYIDPINAKAGAIQDQTNKTIPIITAAATLIAVVVSITQR